MSETTSRGRYTDKAGYVLILVGKGHHLADGRGYAYEHRIVAENMLGRRLLPGEVIHHGPGGKSDNRPENLTVKPSSSAHKRDEHYDPDACRRGQLLGAQTKRRRTLDSTLPRVVAEIRQIIDSGQEPTHARLYKVAGYRTLICFMKRAELVQLAREGAHS